jgi:hypothetical protein
MAHNKALHRTAIPLRFIAAGELGRYAIPSNDDIGDFAYGSKKGSSLLLTHVVVLC